MKYAFEEARKALERQEVPVGAAILDESGKLIAAAGNCNIELNDPTAHAEILVIRQACAIKKCQRLTGCVIYVTLEPCAMCIAAISFARLTRLYFGAYDPKGGAVEQGLFPILANLPEIYGGIEEENATILLQDFFKSLRGLK